MECLSCGSPILMNGYCSTCGLSHNLLVKAHNTANHYYNIGLDRAKVRDLTGAMDALEMALKYNKKHIDARNLLGLVQYEMGEVVLGLTNWVVSSNYENRQENRALRYIKEVQSDPSKLEEANQLARKFNQALQYVKQRNKDIALIQLKRMLTESPHFIKGYLLLALLYMESGNYDKAKKSLRRVIRIDKNNTLAIKYLSEMGAGPKEIIGIKERSVRMDVDETFREEDKEERKADIEAIVKEGLKEIDNSNLKIGNYQEINHNKFNLIYVGVGILIGVLIFWILILPNNTKSVKGQYKDLQLNYSNELSKKNVTISNLKGDVESLEKQLAVTKEELENKANIEMQEEEFMVVKEYISDAAFAALYEEGKKAYDEEFYQKAYTMLSVAVKLKEDEDAYYYLGKSYLKEDKEEKANEAFQTLITLYPQSRYQDEIASYIDAESNESNRNSEEEDEEEEEP